MTALKAALAARINPALFLAVLLLAFPTLSARADSEAELWEKLKIFTKVMAEVNDKFVERPKGDELVYGAIRGMLSALDPHSSFMTPEEMKDFEQETRGSFFGVGIEISQRDGLLIVVSPIEDTPAFRAGLKAGDHILKIDGRATKDMTLTEAVKLIRGARGTKVVFTVSREKTKSLHTISVTRARIPIRSVRSQMLEPGYAYLRIISFQGDTYDSVRAALKDFTGLKGLILDLRNDPGGLLDQSIKVSGLFLGRELVVETRGRLEEQNSRYVADTAMVLPADCPMVVLINEGSASASEIVAGALQDHQRALLVGAQSFGKGSVQTVLPMPDGSGLRLTTALYYTPSGRSIQAEGITPDIETPGRQSREGAIREKDLERHLAGANEKRGKKAAPQAPAPAEEEEDDLPDPDRPLSELPLAERLKYDPQLAKALTLLKENQVPNKFAARKRGG